MIPKFRFFGKVADGEMRMVLAETIDFTSGFVYYSYHDYTVEGDDNVYGDTISFEDCVLMQSTGLFDKNDKEIFEGDIVRFHTPQLATIGVVEFDKNEACFKVRNDFGGHYVTMFHTRYFEVMGDIYQNKELVEELK